VTPERLKQLACRYWRLKVAVVGDLCLDRYLDIDPALTETSLETNLPVHNVVAVRPQPGGAGNVLVNVAAARPGTIHAVGLVGNDGEGFELKRCLETAGVNLTHVVTSRGRATFTYTKPLVLHPGREPEELSRLDIRPRTPADKELQNRITEHLTVAVATSDVIIAMDQNPDGKTGVLTQRVKAALADLARKYPEKVFIADSRNRIQDFANVRVKVNRDELFRRSEVAPGEADVGELAAQWSAQIGRDVFVTLGANGICVASDGEAMDVPAAAVTGPIDPVGAGDTVLAHLALALGVGAAPGEAAELANVAAGIVIRKIATTGTASLDELAAAVDEAG